MTLHCLILAKWRLGVRCRSTFRRMEKWLPAQPRLTQLIVCANASCHSCWKSCCDITIEGEMAVPHFLSTGRSLLLFTCFYMFVLLSVWCKGYYHCTSVIRSTVSAVIHSFPFSYLLCAFQKLRKETRFPPLVDAVSNTDRGTLLQCTIIGVFYCVTTIVSIWQCELTVSWATSKHNVCKSDHQTMSS